MTLPNAYSRRQNALPHGARGIFTESWMQCAFEDVTMARTPSTQNAAHWNYFPLNTSNGMARVGLCFHDFFETGPVITRLGIGATTVANGTWWGLQFGP